MTAAAFMSQLEEMGTVTIDGRALSADDVRQQFVSGPLAPRVLLLTGAPGCGKSLFIRNWVQHDLWKYDEVLFELAVGRTPSLGRYAQLTVLLVRRTE
jgi:hypothetical protein